MGDFIAQEAILLQAWVMWLVIINTLAIVFVYHRVEARWVLAAWIANIFFMNWLFGQLGYVRILGVSHIIFWTPLLVYLWRGRASWLESLGPGRIYLCVLFATNALSLIVDYIDALRYLIGERGIM